MSATDSIRFCADAFASALSSQGNMDQLENALAPDGVPLAGLVAESLGLSAYTSVHELKDHFSSPSRSLVLFSEVGNRQQVKHVLKEHPQLDVCEAGLTAARAGHIGVLERLIYSVMLQEETVRVEDACNLWMLEAARYGRLASVEFLLANGATEVQHGLELAAGSGCLELVELFASKGASKGSEMALGFALESGNTDVINFLLGGTPPQVGAVQPEPEEEWEEAQPEPEEEWEEWPQEDF